MESIGADAAAGIMESGHGWIVILVIGIALALWGIGYFLFEAECTQGWRKKHINSHSKEQRDSESGGDECS